MARVMNKRLATLAKRFANAKAGVDASNRELREASARKLARLLALPDPAAPLAGLKDPAESPGIIPDGVPLVFSERAQ
jgi:hypothetical protein